MSRWIDYRKAEREALITNVMRSKGIDAVAAEKDWWVTAVLYAIFHTKSAEYLLFKGGTSLSKGWNIIDRFSEDIDLALDREFFVNVLCKPFAKAENNTQLHKLREAGHDYILGEFKADLQYVLSGMGLEVEVLGEDEANDENGVIKKVPHDKDPSVIYVNYTSLFGKKDSNYATPTVKIEISILSMREPYEIKRISSLIEETVPGSDNDYIIDIKTVSPARTFLEKAFLICEEYQKDKPRTYRMTRHFYDLEKLSHTPYAEIALSDDKLYLDIVNHRRKYYHVGYVDYDKELPQHITIVPPERLIGAYEEDYKGMQSSFIYGKSLSFKDLINFMKELQQRLRAIHRKD